VNRSTKALEAAHTPCRASACSRWAGHVDQCPALSADALSERELYDSVRAWWRLSPTSAERKGVRHAVAVFAGVTRTVYHIGDWIDPRKDSRQAIAGGQVRSGQIFDAYYGPVGMRVPFAVHSQNATNYWPPNACAPPEVRNGLTRSGSPQVLTIPPSSPPECWRASARSNGGARLAASRLSQPSTRTSACTSPPIPHLSPVVTHAASGWWGAVLPAPFHREGKRAQRARNVVWMLHFVSPWIGIAHGSSTIAQCCQICKHNFPGRARRGAPKHRALPADGRYLRAEHAFAIT
jgi:hypothetical protein